MKMKLLLTLISLLALAESTTLTVGKGKTYSTIGAAHSAAESGDTILISAGTYSEQLIISKSNLLFRAVKASNSPDSNDVTITHAKYANGQGNDQSATVLITGSNVTLTNLDIINTAGNVSQAVALSTRGDQIGVYACSITGWQDTLYVHTGSAFFGRCYVEGAVDFIFGITGMGWFQGCTLGVTRSEGKLTAQGRTNNTTDGEFVFDKANIVLAPGAESGTKGSFYLGRPWGDYARVIFQNSNYNNIIAGVGWEAWNSTRSTANVFFGEYANQNAAGTRVSWAKKLSSGVGIGSILGDYKRWVDSDYLGVSAP